MKKAEGETPIGLLNWTFPLFRVFGIQVRMHWFLALMIVIYTIQGLLQSGTWGLAWMSITMAILLVTILIHEFSHCWMAIRLGAGAEEILLWPLGGLAYVGHTGSSVDEIKVAGIGPISNFILCGACLGVLVATKAPWQWAYLNPFESWWPLGLKTVQVFLLHAARLNLILGLFNLCVPAYPLDGGRILFAFLTIRHGRIRAAELTSVIAIPIGIAIAIWGFVGMNLMLAIIGLWVMFEAYQVRQLAKSGDIDAHPGFAGPEYEYMPDRPRRPGFFARWRARRAEKRARRETEERGRLQLEVDAILEKVSREGIGSLTPSERELLEKASRRQRGE